MKSEERPAAGGWGELSSSYSSLVAGRVTSHALLTVEGCLWRMGSVEEKRLAPPPSRRCGKVIVVVVNLFLSYIV